MTVLERLKGLCEEWKCAEGMWPEEIINTATPAMAALPTLIELVEAQEKALFAGAERMTKRQREEFMPRVREAYEKLESLEV